MERTTCLLLTATLLLSSNSSFGMRKNTRSDKDKKNDLTAVVAKSDFKEARELSSAIPPRRSKSNPELARLIQETKLLQQTVTHHMSTNTESNEKQQIQLSTLTHQVEQLLEEVSTQSSEIKSMNVQMTKLLVAFQARYPGAFLSGECAESALEEIPLKQVGLHLPEFTPKQKRTWTGNIALKPLPSQAQTVGQMWESPAYVPAPPSPHDK